MDNAYQILDELLLWSQFFVFITTNSVWWVSQRCLSSKAEASQPILMGNDHPFDLSGDDRIHHLEKAFAIKIEASANFHDPLIDSNLLFQGVAFQRGALI